MAAPKKILKEAMALKPSQKAQLIEQLLASLDKPDKEIDALWAKEAEDRIDAFEQGQLKAVTLKQVLKKYQ